MKHPGTWFAMGLAGVMLVQSVKAGPAAAPPPAAQDEVPVSSLRDPFWTVGWKPAPRAMPVQKKVAADATAQRWDEAFKQIRVSALGQNAEGKYVATVKGVGVVDVGDTISISYGGLLYRWKVVKISAEGLVPERIGVYAQN